MVQHRGLSTTEAKKVLLWGILCLCIAGVPWMARGEELFTVCYNFVDAAVDLVALNPEDVPKVPLLAGSLFRTSRFDLHTRPAGIHIGADSQRFYMSTHYTQEAYHIPDPTNRSPEMYSPFSPKGLATFDSRHMFGGNTVIRNFNVRGPNGRVDFMMGWQDTPYPTAAGPGITGDCKGNLYHLDRRNGYLIKMDSKGRMKSLPINLHSATKAFQKTTQGLAYNPFNQRFYTAHYGTPNNDLDTDYFESRALLFVTEINPHTLQTTTFPVMLDEAVGSFVDIFQPTEDAIEVSEDGSHLWVMLSYSTGSSIHSSGKKKRDALAAAFPRFASLLDQHIEEEESSTEESSTRTRFARHKSPFAKRGIAGGPGPVYFTGFIKISLISRTFTEGSFYYGTLCSGLTHTRNLCSRNKTVSETW